MYQKPEVMFNAKRFRALRRSAGFSMRELSRALRISWPAYQNLEHGKTKSPHLGLFWKVSQLFRLPMEELICPYSPDPD
jgi:transcriptional regulator with XRE-family HTH domain